MMSQSGLQRHAASRAFTLVELLLTTVLVLLLLGAVVFNFSNLQRGGALEEGVAQFESLLRFARAQAASTGRQVQINFEEDIGDGFSAPLGNLRVLWEPDPLERPGEFEDLPEAGAYVRNVTELVSVELVRNGLTDEQPSEEPGATNVTALSFWPINFFPDGSSDSAEIVLASRGRDDERLMSVRLAGVTGSIRRRIVAPRDEKAEPTAAESDVPTATEETE